MCCTSPTPPVPVPTLKTCHPAARRHLVSQAKTIDRTRPMYNGAEEADQSNYFFDISRRNKDIEVRFSTKCSLIAKDPC